MHLSSTWATCRLGLSELQGVVEGIEFPRGTHWGAHSAAHLRQPGLFRETHLVASLEVLSKGGNESLSLERMWPATLLTLAE